MLCGCSWGVIYAPPWPWPFPFQAALLSSCSEEALHGGLWRECRTAQVGSVPWQWQSSISEANSRFYSSGLCTHAFRGRSSFHFQADGLKCVIMIFYKRLDHVSTLIALISTECRWDMHKNLPTVAREAVQKLSKQNVLHWQLSSFILSLSSRGKNTFWQHMLSFSDIFLY